MAIRGNKIMITAEPKGMKADAIIEGTPKPGVCVTVKTPFYQGNLHLVEPFNRGADGDRAEIAILLEDELQGKTYNDAYVTLNICKIYYPAPGEMFNMWFQNVAGTADDVAAGDYMIVDDGTGQLLVTTGSPEREPFKALGAITDPTADTLLPVLYTGS